MIRSSRNHTLTVVALLLSLGTPAAVRAHEIASEPVEIADPVLPEVYRQGTGDSTLLLIGCMSCRWRSWDSFMHRNAGQYDMIAVTVPGFGGTPVPDLPQNTDGTPWRDALLAGLSGLLERLDLREVTVVGHSWGSMVAVQLAAREPERISRLINVDGSLYSSWVKETREARLEHAREIVEQQSARLADAESWRSFNGGGDSVHGRSADRPPTMERHRSILYHGMFMATSREALIQYWRENAVIDLTMHLRRLEIPILDLQALRGDDLESRRASYLEDLQAVEPPAGVNTVFLYDTSHFVMEHRPETFDRLVADFLAGRELSDHRP